MQAANDEEEVMGQRIWGQGLEQACIYSDIFPGWQVANEIANPRISINSNNSSTDCKKLQPEMEICNRK